MKSEMVTNDIYHVSLEQLSKERSKHPTSTDKPALLAMCLVIRTLTKHPTSADKLALLEISLVERTQTTVRRHLISAQKRAKGGTRLNQQHPAHNKAYRAVELGC